MKATIVYDNEVRSGNLKAGWGFSSLIETAKAPPVLFDTGADSPTLLHNMEELVTPSTVYSAWTVTIGAGGGDGTGP